MDLFLVSKGGVSFLVSLLYSGICWVGHCVVDTANRMADRDSRIMLSVMRIQLVLFSRLGAEEDHLANGAACPSFAVSPRSCSDSEFI